MEKELCFCIEKEMVYLEQVLVDYMDVPIFFLCKDNKQYYIALCTNIEEYNYIVLKASSGEVYDLLHGKIPMRDIILKQKEYWEVISGEEISTDIVEKHVIDMLDVSVLPEENVCFNILTKEIEAYVQKFDNEFYAAKYFGETGKPIVINDLLANEIVSDLKVDHFMDVCDFSVKSQLPKQSLTVMDLTGEYIPNKEKTVVLSNAVRLEEWKNEDTINVAA